MIFSLMNFTCFLCYSLVDWLNILPSNKFYMILCTGDSLFASLMTVVCSHLAHSRSIFLLSILHVINKNLYVYIFLIYMFVLRCNIAFLGSIFAAIFPPGLCFFSFHFLRDMCACWLFKQADNVFKTRSTLSHWNKFPCLVIIVNISFGVAAIATN